MFEIFTELNKINIRPIERKHIVLLELGLYTI